LEIYLLHAGPSVGLRLDCGLRIGIDDRMKDIRMSVSLYYAENAQEFCTYPKIYHSILNNPSPYIELIRYGNVSNEGI
jgi:hypothetical protein